MTGANDPTTDNLGAAPPVKKRVRKARGGSTIEPANPALAHLLVESREPEKAAAAATALVMLEGDFQRLKDIAASVGLPEAMVVALKRRLDTRYLPVKRELQRLKTGEVVEQIEDKISMVLDHLDAVTIGAMTGKDLTIALGILIEKRQLLRGEPTAIHTFEERKTLSANLQIIFHEAQRRGITLDQQPASFNAETGEQMGEDAFVAQPRSELAQQVSIHTERAFQRQEKMPEDVKAEIIEGRRE